MQNGIRENPTNIKPIYQQQAPVQRQSRQLLDDLQYRVSSFTVPVYAPNGLSSEQEVLNVGGFTLLAGGRQRMF